MHRKRSITVPTRRRPEIEIGLLGLSGQPGRRTATLRRLTITKGSSAADRESDGFGLQRDAGATELSRDADRAPEACADSCGDRGDLVFRLEGRHTELLETRQIVQETATPA